MNCSLPEPEVMQSCLGNLVFRILRKWAKLAGVARLSPHDFRRPFVGDLLDVGADLVTIQKMVGHADPATTTRQILDFVTLLYRTRLPPTPVRPPSTVAPLCETPFATRTGRLSDLLDEKCNFD